jgi:hypothetical protein
MSPMPATSSTRPSAPWVGQTTYETDTNKLLVWNGTAWVIPNSPAQNPTGLEFIKAGTFTTATSFSFDNSTFTSTYRNYKVFVDFTASSANLLITARMRASGSDASASSYYHYNAYSRSDSGTSQNSYGDALTLWTLGYIGTGNDLLKAQWSFDLISPQVATTTGLVGLGVSSNSAYTYALYGNFTGRYALNTQFDSMTFLASGGNNFTGVYRIYGYRES